MTKPMVALRIGIAVLGLLGICNSLAGLASEPWQAPSATVSGSLDNGDASLVSTLAPWPRCSSAETSARVKPICFGDGPEDIALSNRFIRLLRQLRSTEGEIETLCRVDTMIVRSLQECVNARPRTPETTVTAFILSGLEIPMARAWRKKGELRRADELYRNYFEAFNRPHPDGSEFKEWASLKLALGELDAAEGLAGRYVAYNRELYDCDRNFLPSLVGSLEFQVDMLEAHDDAERMQARAEQLAQARAELSRLRSIADEHCSHGSCSGCIEGVCLGSPGFGHGCLKYSRQSGSERQPGSE